ncbi:MAG: hypothetical protein ACK5N8_05895 [Alphaproteobacteria bacterium]
MRKFLIMLVAMISFTNNALSNDFVDIDKQLSENRHPLFVAIIYNSIFVRNGDINICEDGYYKSNKPLTAKEVKILENIAEPNQKIKCFVALNGDYYDKSDECILARRNSKKSKVCWFNYKKYLPDTSKTKTDEQFTYLADTVSFFFNNKYEDKFCINKKETTSDEKVQCQKDVLAYISQVDENKAINCKDKMKTEYYELLRQGKELLNIVDNTSIVNNVTGYEQQGETTLFRAIYSDAFGKMFIDKVREFGYENMCSTYNFEQDMKNANSSSAPKTTPKRQGRIVELN